MSLFSALSVAVSSVNALNSAVRVVSDNVANSSNDQYNRRIASFENLQYGGVLISDIARAANTGLLRDLFQQTTVASADKTRDKLFQQIEQLTGTINNQTPLVDNVERLRSAFKALEATPESTAAENDVLIAADTLVQEFTRLSNGLDLIENQVLRDIREVVEDANDTLVEIDRLNAQIVVEKSNGRPTSNLENLRDTQIQKISTFAQIRTFERDDGTLSVYTTSGLVLVDSNPETFSWDEATRVLTISGSNSTNLLTSGQLPDGQLAALTVEVNLRVPVGSQLQRRLPIDARTCRLDVSEDAPRITVHDHVQRPRIPERVIHDRHLSEDRLRRPLVQEPHIRLNVAPQLLWHHNLVTQDQLLSQVVNLSATLRRSITILIAGFLQQLEAVSNRHIGQVLPVVHRIVGSGVSRPVDERRLGKSLIQYGGDASQPLAVGVLVVVSRLAEGHLVNTARRWCEHLSHGFQ